MATDLAALTESIRERMPDWVQSVEVTEKFDFEGEPALRVTLTMSRDLDNLPSGDQLMRTSSTVLDVVRKYDERWPYTRFLSASEAA